MVGLEMAELATVKSAFPSVVTHSDALEFHSLFSTVYAPPATEAVCELHKLLAAWAAVAVRESAAIAASIVTAAKIATGARVPVVRREARGIADHPFTRVASGDPRLSAARRIVQYSGDLLLSSKVSC